ncbi:XRE family transcriptional regulator [Caballeronia sp. LZ028]|uniref:XRE family transcriptional regulator n=1 Tax=Caballeronia sp. LZ028 TaxID=3038563 RepID=UPI002866EB20|nr:XRE family transcriptional regulator [Caballeronia sp. LZ028]MDR5765053.1 XRE family transcriptional regulator [Caballeronia sp. LZ028]
MKYTPPSTSDLARLKADLRMTGKQIAELFGLAGDQQWRKYTGGHEPRQMSAQMLFFAMARLELDEQTLQAILDRMRAAGAQIDLSAE